MTLRNNGRKPVRFTGQHFLRNHQIIRKMIRQSNINKNHLILDIGAGKGAITDPLSRIARRVIAIESQWAYCFNLMEQLLPGRVHPAMPGKFKKIYRK